LWRHRCGPVEPPLRLSDLHYDANGELVRPPHAHLRADEDALSGYLDEARRLLAATPAWQPAAPKANGLSAEFEHLRWFELLDACLVD
jgi:hypothetical protein